MRKIGLLVATAAVAACFASVQPASAITPPTVNPIAASLCQQQGGVLAVYSGYYTCTGAMTLFDLVKAKAVCSFILGGSLSTLTAVVPSILLAPNNGYKCSYASF